LFCIFTGGKNSFLEKKDISWGGYKKLLVPGDRGSRGLPHGMRQSFLPIKVEVCGSSKVYFGFYGPFSAKYLGEF